MQQPAPAVAADPEPVRLVDQQTAPWRRHTSCSSRSGASAPSAEKHRFGDDDRPLLIAPGQRRRDRADIAVGRDRTRARDSRQASTSDACE
ncbi:hypothetical protein C1Y40_00694 [Mycobacterium talmoniae]|uniref:Uncharacterized protein n=1 Tax=Mycobacterium talmoniae TaxID=1858794 RepID=A0A2S8BR49_9MYCO|nr:hypothetical protein C1Y40_00694 [Mycobacterium talmoniae]